ncbi:pectin lyase fold/virulence factor [Apiospora rasikravindrae]|uniref:pectinesterase n=1 Tax=Apiospora rasikravindrae TaxID=990691 RepID=A0ABR1U1C1_9PEZI
MWQLSRAMLLPALALSQLVAPSPATNERRGVEDVALGPPVRTYAECQRTTCRPLAGCPPGTLFVSATSPQANFTTIQAAIASLPHDDTAHTILIAPGTYTEQLNVTRPGPLTLLGQTDAPFQPASPPHADVRSDTDHANAVTVIWSAANADSTGKLTDNAYTSVLTIAPTWEASLTGTGPTGFPVPADTAPGSRDVRLYNLDVRNLAADRAAGPALALGVSYARASFYGCGFYSFQDTVYVGKRGRAFFYDCVVAGEVDFLYGFGTAWVERSTLALRNCGGGITAWKGMYGVIPSMLSILSTYILFSCYVCADERRCTICVAGTNTTFPNKYGAYISSSRVLAANRTVAGAIEGRCPLGRPWNTLHRSVFMNSYLDASVLPAGYVRWQDADPRFDAATTLEAVYRNQGPGYDAAAMAASNVTTVLDDAGVGPYATPRDVFMGWEGEPDDLSWIDQSVLK